MAPTPQAPGVISTTPYDHDPDSNMTDNQKNSDSPVMWITAVIVVGIVIAGVCIMSAILCYNKRRQYRIARQHDPYLSRGEFIKRRKMSSTDLWDEEERQRKDMIRKSLATRSWNSLESRSSRTSSRPEAESFEMDEDERVNLKDDWKAWEARLQRERAASGERHPAAALAPELAIPQPAISRSPSRSPLPAQLPLSPPPRHPARLSMT